MELAYSEIGYILHTKYIATTSIGYTLPARIQEVGDNIFILKSVLLEEVKLKFTIDDVRLRSTLTTNQTIRFVKKIFFYTFLFSI